MDDVIKVNGVSELNKALYSFSQQLGDKVALAALREGANLVRKTLKDIVPVRTGKLRKGFIVARSKIHSGRQSGDMIGVYLTLRKGTKARAAKGGRAAREANPSPFYSRFLNDGWKPGKRGKKSGFDGRQKVPGLRFVQSAFEGQKHAAVRVIIQSAEAGAAVLAKKTGL